ncbi:uncharacterized protein MYCFIDRAFT_204524 [Pseudocercospora fijiensis CIRAD86]|uniref:Major facilitator superfamily (MFS) profile domain-containing protein n=1 Tax=Pseudocercospora fijiensis (strain CIRAD86) TaxID=383855 RepID=M3A6P1_PSEFD|nr:uncharacterized protein MYCFIDRAFT_204524 [Pseudocercospora fijiensis CIRAD86]EME80266.1 hypothetical protein MYCFIDRAFT_204524 [Pseudocercospora fijiensis CIRAD86]
MLTAIQIDVRLVPVLALLYLASHINRANIGNAKIEGTTKDLGLSGIQYNIALSIFFIPYILLEVPSNIILKKFKLPSNIILKKFKRPSTYLGILVVAWGIVMTFTGLVKNFAGLMVRQVQTRLALFYCASALSGAFSGLLAFAIAKMDGAGSLEGIATVLVGVACFFIMPDTPALSGHWLNSEEQRYLEIQTAIKEGGNSSMEKRDKLSDHFQWRAIFIFFFGQMAVALVGFCILLPLAPHIASQIGPCYFAVMLICIGQYPTNPAGSAWISSNLAGDTKRAMGIALNICGYRINRSRDKLDEDEVRREFNDEQLARLGDKSPLFRYKD